MRFLRRDAPPEVLDGLTALAIKYPDQVRYICDMILFATVNKNRRKLSMEYVRRTERQCQKLRDWDARIREARYG